MANIQNASITTYALSSGQVNQTPQATIAGSATNAGFPIGIALDPAGKIYVASRVAAAQETGQSIDSILVFPANPNGMVNEAPLATISGNATGLAIVSGIALDATGRIYVSTSTTSPSIEVFAANPSGTLNEAPIALISGSGTGLDEPRGIAIDGSGKIYVTNALSGTISVFAAIPANGGMFSGPPLATISGPNSTLAFPGGIALDPSGNIYVSNYSSMGGSILEFAANPPATNSDETPIAMIAGSNTLLEASGFLALDSSGKISISQPSGSGIGGSIYTYAAHPTGTLNEAPIGTITGLATGLDGPEGIAIH